MNIVKKWYSELNDESAILETMSDLIFKMLLIEISESFLLLIKNCSVWALPILHHFMKYQIFQGCKESLNMSMS